MAGNSASREANHDGSSNERSPLLKSAGHGVNVVGKRNGSDSGNAANTHHASSDAQDDEITVIAQQLPLSKIAVIMATAWVGVFFGAIDSTVIATLTAPISSEFKSLSLMSWLATAYLISNAACQPISGRLTDIFGRGPGLIFCNIFFSAGNLLCGFSQNQATMVAGRVIAGIGGGGLMSISTFLGSDLVPLRKRGIMQGIGNLCYGSGAMLGGVFGGLINDHTKMGWRLAFIIQAPPTLISAVLAFFLIKVPPKQSNKSRLARIDFAGVFLIVSFLVLLLLGLNAGGNNVPWIHPLPLTAIPLAFVLFLTFLWWESRARQPIIPVKLLMKRTVLAACLTNFFCTMVTISGLFYVPLYLQVRGHSSTQAGLLILPSPVGMSIGSVTSGIIMNKTGKYKIPGIASLIIMNIGVSLFCFSSENTPYYMTGAAFFLVGSGYGAMLTITMLACIAAVEHSQQAVVTSATYLARSMGSTLGITISSAVYQNVLRARLWDRFSEYPHAAEIIARVRDDISELEHLPPGWYDGVIKSFMESFRAVFGTFLCMSLIGLITISLVKQYTLHATLERNEDTEHDG